MVPGVRMRLTQLQVQKGQCYHKNQLQLGAAAASLQGKETASSTIKVGQLNKY